MRGGRFVVYRDRSGLWRWRFFAGNGKIIADGSEGYASRSNALRASTRAKALIARAP